MINDPGSSPRPTYPTCIQPSPRKLPLAGDVTFDRSPAPRRPLERRTAPDIPGLFPAWRPDMPDLFRGMLHNGPDSPGILGTERTGGGFRGSSVPVSPHKPRRVDLEGDQLVADERQGLFLTNWSLIIPCGRSYAWNVGCWDVVPGGRWRRRGAPPPQRQPGPLCQGFGGWAFPRECVPRQPSRDHGRVALINAASGGNLPMIGGEGPTRRRRSSPLGRR
jgi:hypothetical protein